MLLDVPIPPSAPRGRASALIALALLAANLTASSRAAGTCEGQADTILSVSGVDDIFIGRAGDAITVDEQPCGQATVTTVDTIVVHDDSPDGGVNVHLDLSGGPLGPGATAEPEGTSEIEVVLEIAPGGDDYDSVQVIGGPGVDTFTVGSTGIALNDDGDSDVQVGDDYPELRIRLRGGDGNDVLSGQGGHGSGGPHEIGFDFFGDGGDDSITGSVGGDRLEGDAGADTIDGGNGEVPAPYTPWDVIGFTDSPIGVTVDLAAGTATGGDATGDTYSGVDSVFGSDSGDTIFGDDGINALLGDEGNDQLTGRGGDDYLEGGPGGDGLNGGDGFDSINFFGSPEALVVDLGAGTITGGEATGDTFSEVEEVAGTEFDDRLTGDAGSNELDGRGGDDVLAGLGGDDYLADGPGRDQMTGGPGNDYFGMVNERDGSDVADGGDGVDYADYYGRGAPVSMSSDGQANDGERGENDNLISIEGLGASDADDSLKGSKADDSLRGRGGRDDLDGSGGEDLLRGDADADDVNGGGGNDKVKGGDGNDELMGSGGNDVLDGGPGRDMIDGGPGNDTCYVTQGDETKGCERRAHRRAH